MFLQAEVLSSRTVLGRNRFIGKSQLEAKTRTSVPGVGNFIILPVKANGIFNLDPSPEIVHAVGTANKAAFEKKKGKHIWEDKQSYLEKFDVVLPVLKK